MAKYLRSLYYSLPTHADREADLRDPGSLSYRLTGLWQTISEDFQEIEKVQRTSKVESFVEYFIHEKVVEVDEHSTRHNDVPLNIAAVILPDLSVSNVSVHNLIAYIVRELILDPTRVLGDDDIFLFMLMSGFRDISRQDSHRYLHRLIPLTEMLRDIGRVHVYRIRYGSECLGIWYTR